MISQTAGQDDHLMLKNLICLFSNKASLILSKITLHVEPSTLVLLFF